MSNLDSMPQDIIRIIFSNVTERDMLPIRFVSKGMKYYTKGRINKDRDYYHKFINETVRRNEFNMFKWLREIRYFGDKETCKLMIKYDRIEMLSDAFESGWDPYGIDICSSIADNGSMEMMKWALMAGHKISPYDHAFIEEKKYKEWKKWGEENGCILHEYDADFYYEMRGPILEEPWKVTRKHIHTCKDIEKLRRFIMEKARYDIEKEEESDEEYYACYSYEELEKKIYGADDIDTIVRFGDVHFDVVSEFVEDSTDGEEL